MRCPFLVAALACASALAAQPDTARARLLFQQGRVAMTDRRFDDAATAFERAAELNPTRSEYQLWTGYAYARQLAAASFLRKPIIGRRIGPHYDKAVELDSTSVEAAEARVDFYLDAPGIVGGGADKARAEAERLRAINPYCGALAQGKIDERGRDWERAETEYRALARSYPDSSRPMTALVTVLETRERFDEAFTAIDARLARFPNDTVMLYQLGRAAAVSGKELARGATALRRFLELLDTTDPASRASAHYRLGMIREKQGDLPAARAEYDAAIALNPRYEEAITARKRLGGSAPPPV